MNTPSEGPDDHDLQDVIGVFDAPASAAASTHSTHEFRTLTALVPRIAAATLLVLIVGTSATNNDATGDFNKPMYLAILALAIIITAAFLRYQRASQLDVALAVLSAGALIWGIATVERPQLLHYWEGFGNRVALGTVLLLLLFGTLVNPVRFPKWICIALGVIVSICCLSDVLGTIRTFDYMALVGNNLNQINDMLAPIAGKAPDSTFIPEYTALYGWLFVPFKHLLSPVALVGAMAIFLTVLSVATLVLAVWLVGRLFVGKRFLLAAALVVPITLVISRYAGDVSSIASFSQELPIRLFSGFVIAAVGLKDLVLLYRGTLRGKHLLLVGMVCGIISWNSQDFGLVATAVYGVMILFGSTRSTRMPALGLWLSGLIVAAASYPLFLLAIGSPLNVGFVGAFVKSAGSLGAAAIQVPGPVLVVVPIIICSTAAGWALMRIRRRDGIRDDALLDQATITLTFVGTWAAVCLLYYVNRAYAGGQLQTMLLPCGVCVGALLSLLMRTHEFNARWQPRTDSTMWTRWPGTLKMMPLGVFVCLCFSSLLLTTNPISAARTLVDPPAADHYTGYDLPQVISAVDAARRYTSGKGGELTYLGESFNYVSLVTHVPSNALLYGFPFSRVRSSAQTQVAQIECQYLEDHRSKWLVLSLNGVTGFGNDVCSIYHSVSIPGVAYGQLQELGVEGEVGHASPRA